MKIIAVKVIVCSPGRNFVTIKIETDEGIYGLGDATLNGREKSVATYIEEHISPCLIGRNPSNIEDIWQYLYRGAYWRRGPITMTAIAAVDCALWDIKGKKANMPVHELLGGSSRNGVLVYGHANGQDIPATVDAVGRYLDEGYLAVRAQSGIPGLEKVYGIGRGEKFYEPAETGLPIETLWSTPAYLDFAPKLFEAIRNTYGSKPHLLHDIHHRLTPIEAARLGKSFEQFNLFWMEDPVPAENQESLKLIRQHTTTPIAIGEVFNSIWDCEIILREQLCDYIRSTVVHAGGITHLRRIIDLASLSQIRTGCHGATDLSPVCMAAALQIDMWAPNFGIQEYMVHSPETNDVFPHQYKFEKGYLIPGNEPGIGADINEKLAKKYPYKPASLPVARLTDGTMWNW